MHGGLVVVCLYIPFTSVCYFCVLLFFWLRAKKQMQKLMEKDILCIEIVITIYGSYRTFICGQILQKNIWTRIGSYGFLIFSWNFSTYDWKSFLLYELRTRNLADNKSLGCFYLTASQAPPSILVTPLKLATTLLFFCLNKLSYVFFSIVLFILCIRK